MSGTGATPPPCRACTAGELPDRPARTLGRQMTEHSSLTFRPFPADIFLGEQGAARGSIPRGWRPRWEAKATASAGTNGVCCALTKEGYMDGSSGRDVIRRCPRNPVISLHDMPFRCSDIWNAGVVKLPAPDSGSAESSQGGEYLLLITAEMLQGRYSIYPARSLDGEQFVVDDKPFMRPARSGREAMYESGGVRDPRITPMNGEYYVAYVADGDHGLRVGLARTQDFRSVERVAYVSQVDVKNGALFPRKIAGKYLLLKRPGSGMGIWLNYSEDLVYWGSGTVVMTPRGGHWDSNRIGAAGPPIEIDQGWLLIYYGEKTTSAGPLVRLGAALLDRDDPARVLARSNVPILSPREKYERIGDVPNVVFSCGALLEDGRVKLYYGASDSCICAGEAPVEEILRTCVESKKEF